MCVCVFCSWALKQTDEREKKKKQPEKIKIFGWSQTWTMQCDKFMCFSHDSFSQQRHLLPGLPQEIQIMKRNEMPRHLLIFNKVAPHFNLLFLLLLFCFRKIEECNRLIRPPLMKNSSEVAGFLIFFSSFFCLNEMWFDNYVKTFFIDISFPLNVAAAVCFVVSPKLFSFHNNATTMESCVI